MRVMNEDSEQGRDCTIYRGAVVFPNVRLGERVTIFPGAVVGRPPRSSGATRRAEETRDLKPVYIGDSCVIGSNAVIYDDVTIGAGSMICDTAAIREGVRIGDQVVIAMGVTINYDTTVGDRVKIMDNTHITGNMTIENDVFIGPLVTTANDNLMDRKPRGTAAMVGPKVRACATIGQGACILPGVEIGENAIVGSNSVVTKDVAARTVVMGSPARYVRDVRPDEIKVTTSDD